MVSHLPYGESRQRTIQEHKDLGDHHPPFFRIPPTRAHAKNTRLLRSRGRRGELGADL